MQMHSGRGTGRGERAGRKEGKVGEVKRAGGHGGCSGTLLDALVMDHRYSSFTINGRECNRQHTDGLELSSGEGCGKLTSYHPVTIASAKRSEEKRGECEKPFIESQ